MVRPLSPEEDRELDRILSDIRHAFDDIFARLPTEVVEEVAKHSDEMLQFVVDSWRERARMLIDWHCFAICASLMRVFSSTFLSFCSILMEIQTTPTFSRTA